MATSLLWGPLENPQQALLRPRFPCHTRPLPIMPPETNVLPFGRPMEDLTRVYKTIRAVRIGEQPRNSKDPQSPVKCLWFQRAQWSGYVNPWATSPQMLLRPLLRTGGLGGGAQCTWSILVIILLFMVKHITEF